MHFCTVRSTVEKNPKFSLFLFWKYTRFGTSKKELFNTFHSWDILGIFLVPIYIFYSKIMIHSHTESDEMCYVFSFSNYNYTIIIILLFSYLVSIYSSKPVVNGNQNYLSALYSKSALGYFTIKEHRACGIGKSPNILNQLNCTWIESMEIGGETHQLFIFNYDFFYRRKKKYIFGFFP